MDFTTSFGFWGRSPTSLDIHWSRQRCTKVKSINEKWGNRGNYNRAELYENNIFVESALCKSRCIIHISTSADSGSAKFNTFSTYGKLSVREYARQTSAGPDRRWSGADGGFRLSLVYHVISSTSQNILHSSGFSPSQIQVRFSYF